MDKNINKNEKVIDYNSLINNQNENNIDINKDNNNNEDNKKEINNNEIINNSKK